MRSPLAGLALLVLGSACAAPHRGTKPSPAPAKGPQELALVSLTAGHVADVTSAALRPDGRALASADKDWWLDVWDLDAKRLALSVRAPGEVSELAWGGDGSTLAAVTRNGAALWSSMTGEEIHRIVGDEALVADPGRMRLGPDASRLAWIRDLPANGRELVILEMATGRAIGRVSVTLEERIERFLPSGGHVVLVEREGTRRVVDVDHVGSGARCDACRQVDPLNRDSVIFNEGRSAILIRDHAASILDLTTGRARAIPPPSLAALADDPRTVLRASLNRAETRAILEWSHPYGTRRGGTVARLYETAKWTLVRELGSVGETRHPFAFSPDGSVLSVTVASARGVDLVRFDARTGAALAPFEVHALDRAFSADGSRFVEANGPDVRVYDAQSGALVFGAEGPALGRVERLSFRPDGGALAVVEDRGGCAVLTNVDLETGRITARVTLPGSNVISWSRDGRALFYQDGGGPVGVVDPKTGDRRGTLGDDAESFQPSPDGSKVALKRFEGGVEVWDVGTSTRLVQLGATPARLAMAWSPDSDRVITAESGRLNIWDANTGALISTLPLAGQVHAIGSRPDGGAVAFRSMQGLGTVDLATGRVRDFPFSSSGTAVGWSHDGALVLIETARGAMICDPETGALRPSWIDLPPGVSLRDFFDVNLPKMVSRDPEPDWIERARGVLEHQTQPRSMALGWRKGSPLFAVAQSDLHVFRWSGRSVSLLGTFLARPIGVVADEHGYFDAAPADLPSVKVEVLRGGAAATHFQRPALIKDLLESP